MSIIKDQYSTASRGFKCDDLKKQRNRNCYSFSTLSDFISCSRLSNHLEHDREQGRSKEEGTGNPALFVREFSVPSSFKNSTMTPPDHLCDYTPS